MAMKARSAQKRFENGVFFAERNDAHESLLVDVPEALRFYGIRTEEMDADNVSPKEVVFLILSVNAMVAYCDAKKINVQAHVLNHSFRRRMFRQEATAKAWTHAQKAFSDHYVEAINAARSKIGTSNNDQS